MTTVTHMNVHDVLRIEVAPPRKAGNYFPVGSSCWGYQLVVAHMVDGSKHEMTCYLLSEDAALPATNVGKERRMYADRSPE